MIETSIHPATSWVFNSKSAETGENLLINHPVYLAECSGTRMLSENTLEVSFHISNDQGFDFRAGEYLALYFPINNTFEANQALHQLPDFTNQTLCRRSYSIASSPEDFDKTGQISIAISLIEKGVGSNFFMNIKSGDHVFALGPFGNLVLDNSARFERIFLLGTGTGIAPYLSMKDGISGLWDKTFCILAGFRSEAQAIYLDKLADLNQYTHVTTDICLSREKSSYYLHGRIQKHLTSLLLNPTKDCLYLCGNPDMIESVKHQLLDEGFQSGVNLFEESYAFSGHLDDDYPFTIAHL